MFKEKLITYVTIIFMAISIKSWKSKKGSLKCRSFV